MHFQSYRTANPYIVTSGGGGGTGTYTYINVAYPTYETRWGAGNASTYPYATIQNPQGKIYIIDGTTTTTGIYRHCASIADFKTRSDFVAGDWILLPGGQTGGWFDLLEYSGGVPKGASLTNMTVVGTFDPARNSNSSADWPYYNTLRYNMNMAGWTTVGYSPFSFNRGAVQFLSIRSIRFYVSAISDDCPNLFINVNGTQDILLEDCIFDSVGIVVQGGQTGNGPSIQGTTLTSVGTVATLSGIADDSGIQVGQYFVHYSANEAAYNGKFVLTAVDHTAHTATFTFPGNGGVAATGTPFVLYLKGPTALVPDRLLVKNVTFKNCSTSYGFTWAGGGHSGNISTFSTRRFRMENVLTYHGGWSKWATRNSPVWTNYNGSQTAISSITSSGTTATITIPNNYLPSVPNGYKLEVAYATPAAFNGIYTLTRINANQFSYTFAGNSNNPATFAGYLYLNDQHTLTALTSSGTTATGTVASTAGWVNGTWVYLNNITPSEYNGAYQVTVLNATQFTFTFAGTAGASATVLAPLSYQWQGWSGAEGQGPDGISHNLYLDYTCQDLGLFNVMTGFDAANPKLTGAPYRVQNFIAVYCPIAWIASPIGNESTSYPSGGMWECEWPLLIGSDVQSSATNNASGGGWGPHNFMSNAGSFVRKGLFTGQGGTNVQPWAVTNNGFTAIPATLFIDNLTTAGWLTPVDLSAPSNPGGTITANNTLSEETAYASFGTGNALWSSQSTAIQAKRTDLLTKTVGGTFATAMGVSITFNADPKIMALQMFDYMRDNWTARDWVFEMQKHYRSALD